MRDDPNRNPEADTFMYIQLLVESLNSLGRLDVAVDTITQRLPVELFKIVEKSSNEADQRHPSTLRGSKDGRDVLDGTNSARNIVLNDLLGTLFARFEAIAEGHRVVHEIIAGILKREGLRTSSSLTGGFRELWKLYQSEIRSLLHDYLAADGNLAYSRGQGNDRGSNIFSRNPRDKTKKMFKLTDMDSKSSDLTTEREDLEGILKSSVPGLVSDSKRPELTNQASSNAAIDGSATGHKLLVEPSVFNMGILLPPSLTFLQRLKEVVPPTSDIALSTLTSFLDDFLINVFLPQLEETLTELCAQTFVQNDAFQQDSQWANHSKKPIFKGTHKFFTLITAFCRMLGNLPHDQAFSQLIVSQMIAYYERCYNWLKVIVARPQPHPVSGKRLKMSAAMTDEGPVKDVVIGLAHADEEGKSTLIQQETDLLIKSAEETPIEEVDLVTDRRNIASICCLATSMKWLATKIAMMRHISNQATDSSRRESVKNQRRWTLITNADKTVEDGRAYLPLNNESAVQFDGVVSSYQQLAESVVRLLHVEIRNHVTFFLGKSMERSFLLPNEVHEPDEQVLKLNADIVAFEEELVGHLLPSQQSYVPFPPSPSTISRVVGLLTRVIEIVS
jgi:exocyst complex component 4